MAKLLTYLFSLQRQVKYALLFDFNTLSLLIFTEHPMKITRRSLQGIQLRRIIDRSTYMVFGSF